MIIDTGATKSVIGSEYLKEIVSKLSESEKFDFERKRGKKVGIQIRQWDTHFNNQSHTKASQHSRREK